MTDHAGGDEVARARRERDAAYAARRARAEGELRATLNELQPMIDVAVSASVEERLLDKTRPAMAMDALVDAALSMPGDRLSFSVIEHLREASALLEGYLPTRWPELRARLGVQETAQEVFRQMLRDEIGPALRALGFKGSGQEYSLPSATHWALLSFQRSRSSTVERIKFAVNYGVITKEAWEERRWSRSPPERPAPERPSTAHLGDGGTIVDRRSPGSGGLQHWFVMRLGAPCSPS